jgi:serine/threonine protein kinase
MGAVYLAERDDAQFAHRVAVKILSRAIGSPEAVARFRDERQILAAPEHHNIVRLLDGGSTDDDLPYLVMEYIEGKTITKFADHHALSVRARVELVRQVCAALQYAHQNLIVHRDIKPSNILVDATGAPKILDFGIAKLLAPTASFRREARTRTGFAIFTPEYASPEQAREDAVSTATDVYSVGAVLYELVTGQAAHRATGGRLEILHAICEVDPPRPSTVAPPGWRRELAGDLDNIILKALHKEHARRYASMEQLADDLGRWLDGLPVAARTRTLGYRTRKFVRRNKGTVAAITLVAATLIAATFVSLRQAHRADERGTQAERARAIAVDEAIVLATLRIRAGTSGRASGSSGYLIRAPTGDAFAEYPSNPEVDPWSRRAAVVAAGPA